MANASCSTCTLVSNLLTLTGSVSGTVLVGMTITGAGVPPGVTITSDNTGTGGAGSYNCSASSANVTVAEPMVFSLAGLMPFVGNSLMGQIVDIGLAAGFATIFAAAIPSPTAAMGQEYQHGTHSVAIYNQQAGARIFPPVKGIEGRSVVPTILTQGQYPEPRPSLTFRPPNLTSAPQQIVRQFIAAPQQFDLTQNGWFVSPLTPQAPGFTFEYQFGTHAKAIYDSQAGGKIFPAVLTPPVVSNSVPFKTIIVNPQELSRDLTIQGWTNIVPVPTGWLLTMVTAGPQLADLTQQAQISHSRPFQGVVANWNPRTIISVSQDNPTQLQPFFDAPPTHPAVNINPKWFFASQADPTQVQPVIFQRKIAGGQKYEQPSRPQVREQAYSNPPSITFKPVVLFVPPAPSPVAPMFVTGEQFYLNVPFANVSAPIILSSTPPPPPTLTSQPGQYGDRVILPAKKLGETVYVAIDFISRLGVGETIVSAVCLCTVYTGNDPNPSATIVGAPVISGTIVDQLTTGGVLGTIYELLARATTSLGQVLELSGFLAVVPDLP